MVCCRQMEGRCGHDLIERVADWKRKKCGKYFQGASRDRGDDTCKVVIVMNLADNAVAM